MSSADPCKTWRPKTEDIAKLLGTVPIKHTLADRGSILLRKMMVDQAFVHALGAVTGNQAVQMVRGGVPAIYASGWQCAADANLAGHTYSDQSLYPANSMPALVRRINNALQRADQIDSVDGVKSVNEWLVPIVADAEAGFGGPLNAYELMKALIEAGAAGVHFEDQLASEKKCGHMGGKVLVPRSHFIRTLKAARLAACVAGTGTVLIARTDTRSAKLMTSDVDLQDKLYLSDERTPEGFYRIKDDCGLEFSIDRGLAFAPYADMLWMETSTPDLDEARAFAEGIHSKFPGKQLAYNCSPSFNWKKKLDDTTIANFQKELGKMGYAFQFITLAGFHALNHGMFNLARDYEARDMPAYVELQEKEFADEAHGYTATKHQHEVGTGYFDVISQIVAEGASSTTAMEDSTETEQF